jgi:hypothetical protein
VGIHIGLSSEGISMNATALRRIALLLIALVAAAVAAPPADAGRIFGRGRCHQRPAKRRCCPPVRCCPTYGGCLCIKFMYADLGETEVYYAHEHDDCSSFEQCTVFAEVWHTGENLPVNQVCPYNCTEMRCLPLHTVVDQPKLSAPRPEGVDIHAGDPDVRLTMLPKSEKAYRTGIFYHPDDRREIPVKVFFMRVHTPRGSFRVCVGVEVESITVRQFEANAVRLPDLDYVYQLDYGSGPGCVVIASQ